MRHPSLLPLSHDHHHGLALALRCRKQALGQLKPMGAAGLRLRAAECLDFYRNHLVGHFQVEEEVLFPALREALPQCTALIDELVGEHERLHQLVARLEAGTGLAKEIFDLGDLLEAHIRKEERQLFPLFEKQLEAGRAEAIGAEIAKRLARGEGS
jgi:iron-sulfur cluster repair protein YtfE (RIC family)